ncbi:hypothetical protein LCGC14_0431060 [marine sediment metagenome]|uniref:Uncharacterized protein n=1 Tax=marine sediment metagenome TaxID=412755 RepID=A0A0F9VA42_9ZZZZ
MEITKGKWIAKREHNSYNIYGDDKLLFLSYQHTRTTWAEMEANAHLVVAGPRMAELLKQLADWDAGTFGKDSNIKIIDISKEASKIIAELEGK